MTPQSASRRGLVEAEDLLDAAVAVRGHDQDRPRQLALRIDSEQQIVMKLTLLPMVEDLVATESPAHVVEERTQAKVLGKLIDGHPVSLPHARHRRPLWRDILAWLDARTHVSKSNGASRVCWQT
jgi:hypothetical protein